MDKPGVLFQLLKTGGVNGKVQRGPLGMASQPLTLSVSAES